MRTLSDVRRLASWRVRSRQPSADLLQVVAGFDRPAREREEDVVETRLAHRHADGFDVGGIEAAHDRQQRAAAVDDLELDAAAVVAQVRWSDLGEHALRSVGDGGVGQLDADDRGAELWLEL